MIIYEIMHKDLPAASLDQSGRCEIFHETFLPYGLYLEETDDDLDTMVNNLINFHAWCSSRMLTLDRRYAKEILNTLGLPQTVTDRERAAITLSYHCLSLTDVFWVRESGEKVAFDQINLYHHHLSNAFVEVSLRGRSLTVGNAVLQPEPDISTNGCFPKAWVRKSDGFWLYKDGAPEAVENELLASRIARCFDVRQVLYEREEFDGTAVSASRLFTSMDYGLCSWEQYQIYAMNHDLDPIEECLRIDPSGFDRMNIVDYLVGNTDRHWGNWGWLIDHRTNRPVSLHPLMDFNQSFGNYDTIEGAACLTCLPERLSQKEAAERAAVRSGLGQVREIPEDLFGDRTREAKMFRQRLAFLKEMDPRTAK